MGVLNRVFVDGTTVLSADDLNQLQAAWTNYTPTATNFTVGNGTLIGRYHQIGKTVIVRINFLAGSTSTFTASGIAVSLPVPVHGTGTQWLKSTLGTPSNFYAATALTSGSSAQLYAPPTSTNATLAPVTSANNNPGTSGQFQIEDLYEAA